LAESYDFIVDFVTMFQDRWWKRWVAERLDASRPHLILDVGCGTLLFEERYSSIEREFVGLDLSKEMLILGRDKRISTSSMIVQGDAEFLPFRDGSFDAVISCYVTKYVDLETFGREVSKVTRQQGAVILYDFAKPRGPLAPPLLAYISVGLRAIGLLLQFTRNKSAFTFIELPRIIEDSAWDLALSEIMRRNGVGLVDARPLTGGAVFAYYGKNAGVTC
jgi:ubiquinone/menaquinone biosynthesis C-methylase UbiE